MMRLFPALLFFTAAMVLADGPADNLPDKVRPVPPPGIDVPENVRAELKENARSLIQQIDMASETLSNKPALLQLLPDALIFYKAVDYALRFNEFYTTNEFQTARSLLKQGEDRLQSLRRGEAPWTTATGLVVRAYTSKIDGSVQPYGLVVPPGFATDRFTPRRLDAWFHGRGEKLTELAFLQERQRSAGEFTPPGAFVLHLYGRYCNANKFAGEIDLFEALEDVQKNYSIDPNRLVIRGFSMGGAACWQFAVHYPGKWAAAAPGAGFSETADFLRVFQNEPVQPAWYEKKLWHWYDCTDYAVNLFNCPTVAYSGEDDRQKQAADIMAKALEKEGMTLTHIIGPKTGHKYHPDSKAEINRRIDSIAALGRNPLPRQVKFTTWTLRYPEMGWVKVEGLEEHWTRARVDASILDDLTVEAKTENVSLLAFEMEPGLCPLAVDRTPIVRLDGQKLEGSPVLTDRSWKALFAKENGQWRRAETSAKSGGLRKKPGLQGPIDDAFMDSFLMVSPSGKPLSAKAGAWVAAEQAHAVDHWRRQFRGEARVRKDVEITDADVARHHLILWGDPQSNELLGKIISKLPIRWDARGIHTPDAIFPSDQYVPILIYPNPLNPEKYVVLNSGFTFREYDYLNNARQVAKLPDFAIVDLSQPPNARFPGKISKAGFFDEFWQFKKETP